MEVLIHIGSSLKYINVTPQRVLEDAQDAGDIRKILDPWQRLIVFKSCVKYARKFIMVDTSGIRKY